LKSFACIVKISKLSVGAWMWSHEHFHTCGMKGTSNLECHAGKQLLLGPARRSRCAPESYGWVLQENRGINTSPPPSKKEKMALLQLCVALER
jgi:hypothetical protein